MGWIQIQTSYPSRGSFTATTNYRVVGHLMQRTDPSYYRAGLSRDNTSVGFADVHNSKFPLGTTQLKADMHVKTPASDGDIYIYTVTVDLGSAGFTPRLKESGDPTETFNLVQVDFYAYVPTPPSTPSSITVPATIKGGDSFTVSWGSGSGATSYYLERSINGGAYTQVYSGASRSYSDTITKGWISVGYRVRASGSDGSSGYRTSPTITIKNFLELRIRADGALKTSDYGWARVGGALREIEGMWTIVDGVLKEL